MLRAAQGYLLRRGRDGERRGASLRLLFGPGITIVDVVLPLLRQRGEILPIRLESAVKVDGVIAAIGKDLGDLLAPIPHPAEHDDRLVVRHLAQPRADLVERDIDRAIKAMDQHLVGLAQVQQRHRGFVELSESFRRDALDGIAVVVRQR